MATLYKNGLVYMNGEIKRVSILVENGVIVELGDNITKPASEVVTCDNFYIFPGFTDVHVHFREPGYEYKETILTGTNAAVNGGYTNVCTMPNLKPVPDSLKNLKIELDAIERDAQIHVHPYGSITKGEKGVEVSDMEEMAPYVIGFSDDGCGVQDEGIMREAMARAKELNKPICGHCEVKNITGNGVINDGIYAKMNNIPGIPNSSEYVEVERNIKLAEETGCHFHVCHASTKETVDMVRNAKNRGIKVTCETGPQYLLLSEMDTINNGAFRFQPPLRTLRDRIALLEALRDGTIDMIATDHAPHSLEEKSRGIRNSLNGIVGLECAFPMLYTYLVKEGIISLEDLLKLMIDHPKKEFGIGSEIAPGNNAEFTIWDLDTNARINSYDFKSKGRYTPFDGKQVVAQRKLTVFGNRTWETNWK